MCLRFPATWPDGPTAPAISLHSPNQTWRFTPGFLTALTPMATTTIFSRGQGGQMTSLPHVFDILRRPQSSQRWVSLSTAFAHPPAAWVSWSESRAQLREDPLSLRPLLAVTPSPQHLGPADPFVFLKVVRNSPSFPGSESQHLTQVLSLT